jgi:hypothetical protein
MQRWAHLEQVGSGQAEEGSEDELVHGDLGEDGAQVRALSHERGQHSVEEVVLEAPLIDSSVQQESQRATRAIRCGDLNLLAGEIVASDDARANRLESALSRLCEQIGKHSLHAHDSEGRGVRGSSQDGVSRAHHDITLDGNRDRPAGSMPYGRGTMCMQFDPGRAGEERNQRDRRHLMI